MRSTIFARSSGAGRSGVTVHRISGPLAGAVLEEMAGTRGQPRKARLVRLRLADGSVLDEGLVLWFPAPASFTGEDVAELHLHGSVAVERALHDALIDRGLVHAEPGAFTLRAFENGKLDLSQAEGLADLLRAETEGQRRHALGQLGGRLSEIAAGWRSDLVAILALLTASIDFADEDDVPDALGGEVTERLDQLVGQMDEALAGARSAAQLRDGTRIVLTGPPNAGKSSLLNALAGHDHAIVSDVPGTTRDAIEVRLERRGQLLVLVDTAGLREADDIVERMGIARARQAVLTADLRLELRPIDEVHVPAPVGEALYVATKVDDPDGSTPRGWISTSVRRRGGLDELLDAIDARLDTADAGPLVRQRQVDATIEAKRQLVKARSATEAEIAALEVRGALLMLGTLTGDVGVEEVLGAIFAEFCIGK